MLRKVTVIYLIAALLTITTAQCAFAGFSPSFDAPAASDSLKLINAELGRADVIEKLSELGFAPDEISARIAQLSPQELNGLATDIEQVRAGGDLLGVLLLVFLIILLLDLTGHTSYIIHSR